MVVETKSAPLLPVKSGHMTLTMATAERLREAIHQGNFAPGSQLPPELELIAMLGVSRTTLREALRALEEQRLIVRRRGLGTFVCERSILKDLSINFGISEMIRQAGLNPGTQEAVVRTEKASMAVAKELAIPKHSLVVVLDRVRTADGLPVVWSLDIISKELLGAHAIETMQLETMSFYQYLEENLHMQISRGLASLGPVTANDEMAAKLNVRPGTPLMHVVQTDYDASDRPILHSIEYHLPDAFLFVVNRRGPHW